MQTTIIQLKTELIRRYNLIKYDKNEKVTFEYFEKMHDYVDWIEENIELKKVVDKETKSLPQYFLVKRGWSVGSTIQIIQSKTDSEFSLAYLNLFNVYLAIDDLGSFYNDKSEDDPDNYYISNRIISAKELAKVRDSYKLVGYSYFCFNKKKYANWLKIVHEELLLIISFIEIKESKKQDKAKEPIKPVVEEVKLKPKVEIVKTDQINFTKKLKLTDDAKWQDLEIKFLSEFGLEITNRKARKSIKVTHSDLGFGDKRAEKSGKTKAINAYKFLKLLAIENGIFPLSKLAIGGKEREERTLDKKKVSEILRNAFLIIDDDPFKKFNKFNIQKEDYKIKINLIPAPEFRDFDFQDHSKGIIEVDKTKSKEDKKNDEIINQRTEVEIIEDEKKEQERKEFKDMLDEQAPTVYEGESF